MSFFEDIAAALDAEGVESRVNDDVLFVPITSDIEIQFVEIDAVLPAANVYIAAADVDEDDEYFEAALVSVAFSVEDAVATVAEHIATDQVVTVLRDLLEGRDERIANLEFEHHHHDPAVVLADVAENSHLRVAVELSDGVPTASLSFLAYTPDANAELISPLGEPVDQEDQDTDSDFSGVGDLEYGGEPEILELGTFTDFDRLFEVLSLCVEQAEDWELQLKPCDDGIEAQ